MKLYVASYGLYLIEGMSECGSWAKEGEFCQSNEWLYVYGYREYSYN